MQQQKMRPQVFSVPGRLPSFKNFPEQDVLINIVADIQISATKFSDGKVCKLVHLDLHNSFVDPKALGFDQNDQRGWFLDECKVWAWCGKSGSEASGDMAKRINAKIVSEAPQGAVDQSGNISSSISYSVDGSLGVFAGAPTANAGAGLTIGNSYSHAHQDFSFARHSGADYMHHVQSLDQLADGADYQSPKSLLDIAQSPFVGARLRGLPDLAKSALPCPSQCIFEIPESFLDGMINMYVKVQAYFSCIQAAAYFVALSSDSDGVDFTATPTIPIDLRQVSVPEST